MKLCYIHTYRHRFGVEPICAVLSEHDMKIAPQTYYRWLACPVRPAELEDAYLVTSIGGTSACTACGRCGTPPAGPGWHSAATRSAG